MPYPSLNASVRAPTKVLHRLSGSSQFAISITFPLAVIFLLLGILLFYSMMRKSAFLMREESRFEESELSADQRAEPVELHPDSIVELSSQ
jgi:preprotein translocase subunit SecG